MRQNIQRRILTILWNILKQTIVPILGLLFSWIITKKFSVGLWGEVAQITLWVSIITHLSAWGNTEYMLKKFSAQPGKLKLLWQKCLVDRLPILFITCCGLAIYFRNSMGILIIAWCMVEYIYQSYEPVISFHKKFRISFLGEIGGAIILFLLLFIFRVNLGLWTIISLLMISDLCKTIIVTLYFSNDLFPINIQKPDFHYYANSLSFFLLGFIGLLYSRADLIYVTTYLNHQEIAFYQIATTFFSFTKSGASMLILPFVPVIYRLKKNIVYKLSIRFVVAGIVLSIFSLIVIYFILTKSYKFPVGLPFMLAGFLSIIPVFYSYAIVTFLFRKNRQNKVVFYSIIGILVDFSLSALLVPPFGTLGAIIAAAIAQWAVIPFYLYEMYAA